MRCPKCGAFIEDGKDTCFMCGTNINTYTGSTFNSGFSNDYMQQKQAYDQRNDYRNVQITAKEGDKDIFDFVQEHKILVDFLIVVVVLGIVALIGVRYYNSKSKAIVKKAVIPPLYYEIDDSLHQVQSSNGEYYYTRSGATGVECSIRISTGSSQSNDHVNEFFKSVLDSKTPELDENGNVENSLDEFVSQQGMTKIHDVSWNYLNLFYKEKADTDYISLKYRYLVALHNGIYYNIELFNNSNDNKCSSSIDYFARSLEFIKEESGD